MPTYADLVRRFGLAFRPDYQWTAYAGHPAAYPLGDPAPGETHDAVVRAEFALHEQDPASYYDPYDAALLIWRADGLLGTGDPGPPAFRAAHDAYVARKAAARAEPPLDVSAPDAIRYLNRVGDASAGASESGGRPRLALQEMLDAVAQFHRETHPLRINTRTQGTFAEMKRAFNVHRDVLVVWFAERGVDVDPEE